MILERVKMVSLSKLKSKKLGVGVKELLAILFVNLEANQMST